VKPRSMTTLTTLTKRVQVVPATPQGQPPRELFTWPKTVEQRLQTRTAEIEENFAQRCKRFHATRPSRGLRVLSICDGCSTGALALRYLGMPIQRYTSVESDLSAAKCGAVSRHGIVSHEAVRAICKCGLGDGVPRLGRRAKGPDVRVQLQRRVERRRVRDGADAVRGEPRLLGPRLERHGPPGRPLGDGPDKGAAARDVRVHVRRRVLLARGSGRGPL
jgi:hypothetical protein